MAGLQSFIMAVVMVLGGGTGVAMLDDLFTDYDKPTMQEKLTKKVDRLEVKMALIDACREWSNCTADVEQLDEMEAHVSEKLAAYNACIAGYANCTFSDIAHNHSHYPDNATFEQKMELKSQRTNNLLEMIDACRNVDSCNLDDSTLDELESKLQKRVSKRDKCANSPDECKKKCKHKKHRTKNKLSKLEQSIEQRPV
mgnify:CR=1 FL=1